MNSIQPSINRYFLSNFFSSNKLPLIITMIFFFSMLYIDFFHHTVWSEQDGIYYYYNGKEFFDGNAQNIQIIGAPFGTSIIYEVLNHFFAKPFEIAKGLSLISGTVIVLVSYFIVKNIFSSKIAIISQVFIAINPRFQFLSFSALNELMPIATIALSLYFLTKEHLKNSHVAIIGLLLGLSFMMRYQSIFIVLGILIFLFLRNKNHRQNLTYSVILILIFVISASPMLIYNYLTYNNPMENDTSFYLLALFKYQTPEWHESVQELRTEGISTLFFNDPNLFLKNYLFNIFSHNPNKIFNFGTFDNLSLIPLIPFIGFITVTLGFFHVAKVSNDKRSLISLIILGIVFFLVLLFGEFSEHYFAILFIPLLSLGILSINKIKTNFLPLLILSVVLFAFLSVIPVYRSYHFLLLLLPFSILNSIFLIEFLPKIFTKKSKGEKTI